MNTKQRDELAKYCWDIGKISFAGVAATLGLVLVAMYLRRTRR